MDRVSPKLLLLVLLLASIPREAHGQSLLVQLKGQATGEPVSGAFVALLREDGEFVRGALTNDEGRYLFLPGSAGVFTVRAEMIGYATVERGGLSVGSGESISVTMDLPYSAIRLEGIEIRGEERCRLRPEEATATAQVWEEARKALSVQRWAEDEGTLQFSVQSYNRDLEPRYLRVTSESQRVSQGASRNPIRSLPPEVLAREGFIQEVEGGQFDYFAPDASVLLSDYFLDTHCLRITTTPEDPGYIGLAFEPTPDRTAPDIEGVFWLDERSYTLHALDFHYTWSPWPELDRPATGRIEFQGLPNGAWIVRRWWIRIPLAARRHFIRSLGGTGLDVVAYREVGGEVTDISTTDRVRLAGSARSTLQGRVWDSIRGRPLQGARVFLEGTLHSAVTDSAGNFVLTDLPGGRYLAKFEHLRLDSLAVVLPGVEVDLVPGRTSEGSLGIPSWETLALAACRVTDPDSTTGVLVGQVLERRTGDPIPGVTISVRSVAGGHTSPAPPPLEVATDLEGWYRVCGPPVNQDLVAVAQFHSQQPDSLLTRVESGGSRRLDFVLGVSVGFFSTITEVSALPTGDGVQGVQGRVVDRTTGNPVPNAEVILRSENGRLVASGATNNLGAFRLLSRLPGVHTLSVTALGYDTIHLNAFEIGQRKLDILELGMAPAALEMAPLVVTATPRSFDLEMRGFYERSRFTGGYFIPPEVIEERMPSRATQLFLTVPGATLVRDQSGHNAVWFSRNASVDMVVDQNTGEATAHPCWPRVYVDGILMNEGGGRMPAFIDGLIHPSDIAGIEVYRSPSEVPARFGALGSRCGVLVIWSKTGGGGDG